MIISVEAEPSARSGPEHNDSYASPTTSTSPSTDLTLCSTSSNGNSSNNRSNFLTNSSHSKLVRSNTLKYILGVVYIQEFLPHGNIEPKKAEEVAIGTLVLAEQRTTVYANQLRQMIVQQSLFNMDNSYVFLTNFGSPISIGQEMSIELKHLVNDQNIVKFKREYSRLRCPVIGQHSNGQNILIGYVLSSFDTDLKTLRVKIEEVLRDSSQVNSHKLSTSFHFIHSFHYSIHRNNESNIILVDIMLNKCVFIRFDLPLDMYITGSIAVQDKYLSNDDFATGGHLIEDQTDNSKSKSIKKPSILRRKTLKLQKSTLKSSQKQIMISYARQEAADHALKLKESLHKRGYSVYLDVHEIEMGCDWQDSLNLAIQNCYYFVPLITPMYGRTQWTNREVKLADVLNKHIIPINFLEIWPPECLAIQFATTQYIIWRSPTDDAKEKDLDKKVWDHKSIEQVTQQLVGQINKMETKKKKEAKVSISTSNTDLPSVATIVTDVAAEPNNNAQEKPLIVISAHPNQFLLAKEIKNFLVPNYQVWCSNDITDNVVRRINEDVPLATNLRDSIYDPNLSPIIEENSTLSHANQDYARKIVENSKQRPKSVPNNENSEFKLDIKKKDVARVLSYNGEVSYLSSISPDKKKRLKAFQDKVLSSSLVIIIASEQYYKSRTSEQHVYYCGQRKKTILVQCDKSAAPVWFSKLMSQDIPLNYENKEFQRELKNKISLELDPSCTVMEPDCHEMKIKYLTKCMKKNLPNLETCVFVLGGNGGKTYENQRTVDICTQIGKELADVANINIVTNGFYGSSDIVAVNFVEQRKCLLKESNDSVIHIVPMKDPKDYSKKCRQDKDGNFEKVTYGKTYFLGETIKERDSVIAKLMDTCILIEGDRDAAHEIEEFIWNDHFVVPVCSTGGAAAGNFEVPAKIFQCPNGVRENDWSVLSNPDATASEVAKAVVHVICDLKKAIHEHAISKNVKGTLKKWNSEKPLKRKIAARKRLNLSLDQKNMVGDEESEKTLEPASPEKVLPIFNTENEPMSDESCKGIRNRNKSSATRRRSTAPLYSFVRATPI